LDPFNPPSKGKKYILVCTDYVIKWVEAKAFIRATKITVVNFLFEDMSAQRNSNKPRDTIHI